MYILEKQHILGILIAYMRYLCCDFIFLNSVPTSMSGLDIYLPDHPCTADQPVLKLNCQNPASCAKTCHAAKLNILITQHQYSHGEAGIS